MADNDYSEEGKEKRVTIVWSNVLLSQQLLSNVKVPLYPMHRRCLISLELLSVFRDDAVHVTLTRYSYIEFFSN